MTPTDAPSAKPHPAAHAAPAAVSPFGDEERAALEEEDAEAGRVIGRLLSFFFLYTIVVMALAAWWTWDAIR